MTYQKFNVSIGLSTPCSTFIFEDKVTMELFFHKNKTKSFLCILEMNLIDWKNWLCFVGLVHITVLLYTGCTKSTLPMLNSKYFLRLSDFLQNHSQPLQSPEFWGCQIFPECDMQNSKQFWKISSTNGLICLNKYFFEECQPCGNRNLAFGAFFSY